MPLLRLSGVGIEDELERYWYLYRGGVVAGVLIKDKGLIAVPLTNDERFDPHPIVVNPHGQEVHLFRRPDNWPLDGRGDIAIPFPGQRGWKAVPGTPNLSKAIAAPDTVPVLPDWAIEGVQQCRAKQKEIFAKKRQRELEEMKLRISACNTRFSEGGDGGCYEEREIDAPLVESKPLLKTAASFAAELVPPSFVVNGLFMRGYLYSCTAMTGSGKTAIALLITELMANRTRRRNLGPHKVKPGRVVYIACENANDVRCRLVGMAEKMDFRLEDLDLLVVDSVFDLEKNLPRIAEEVDESGGNISLVFIDTSAAMFQGLDEKNNTQVLAHAKTQRSLCSLPGNPCVVALNHPTKVVTKASELLPRGGGAYLNEVAAKILSRSNSGCGLFALKSWWMKRVI